MFADALFTVATIWEQPKCPSIDGWIRCCIYIYNGILLIHKKEWNLAIWDNWIDPDGTMLSEISQTEKDKYHNKKTKQIPKTKQTKKETDT